jgi:hypothetical protein
VFRRVGAHVGRGECRFAGAPAAADLNADGMARAVPVGFGGQLGAAGILGEGHRRPAGRLVWASPPLPGAQHEMGADREHGILNALHDAGVRVVAHNWSIRCSMPRRAVSGPDSPGGATEGPSRPGQSVGAHEFCCIAAGEDLFKHPRHVRCQIRQGVDA